MTITLCDADWQKIQDLLHKQREWLINQVQTTVQSVDAMLVEERKKAMNRYKEYDGCYLGHYAQWFFWFFFTIGFSVVAGNHVLAPVMLLQSFQQQPLLQIQQVSLHPYILLHLNPLSNPYILLYSVVPASFRCPHTSINHFHTGTTGIPPSVPSSSYVISRHFQSSCALVYFTSGGTSLL